MQKGEKKSQHPHEQNQAQTRIKTWYNSAPEWHSIRSKQEGAIRFFLIQKSPKKSSFIGALEWQMFLKKLGSLP